MRLWGLFSIGAVLSNCGPCVNAVLAAQRSDGGWGQLEEMDSDAYATGQTMYILHATGFDPANAIMHRAAALLLKTQGPRRWLLAGDSALAAHPAVL